MQTYSPLILKDITDGIPFEKIKDFLGAGIVFRIEIPGNYVFILDEGKVYLRDLNYDD